MDRTDELLRIASIFQPETGREHGGVAVAALWRREDQQPQSLYQRIALQVASNLDCNDLLMRRMDVLAGRKEFSNDPTSDMAEISGLFQKKVAVIKGDMEQLKQLADSGAAQENSGPHQQQHYRLVFQALNKRMLRHIDSFQQAVKLQAALVEQRVRRVSDKYGQGTAQISRYAATKEVNLAGSKDSPMSKGGHGHPGVNGIGAPPAVPNYAMFAPRSLAVPPREPLLHNDAGAHGHELRRRGGAAVATAAAAAPVSGAQTQGQTGPLNKGTTDNKYLQRSPYGNSSWSGPSGFVQMQQQAPQQKSLTRFKLAEKAEAQIAQMGQLFQQMASLVVEQSETISRIEDDVENGLTDTKEGHRHLTDYYERTKGNRGMIVKVFCLLAFFILLFCWFF